MDANKVSADTNPKVCLEASPTSAVEIPLPNPEFFVLTCVSQSAGRQWHPRQASSPPPDQEIRQGEFPFQGRISFHVQVVLFRLVDKADDAQKIKFRVGDKVVVMSGGRSLEGPFRVDRVTDSGGYVLCTLAGEDVNSGREYEESELEFA
jgi:hypothetical protein